MVLDTLLALGAIAAVAAGAFALYGRLVARDDPKRAVARLRRALKVWLAVAFLAGVVAFVATGGDEALDAALAAVAPGLPGSRVGGAVSLFVGGLAGLVPVVAGYFGAFPALRRVREVDLSGWTALRRLLRFLVAGLAVLVVLLVGTGALLDALPGGVGFLVAVAVVVGLVYAGAPSLVRLVADTRPPTDAERDRLGRLADRAGLDYRRLRVQRTGGDRVVTAYLRGLPGFRHCFVTDDLLAADDDVATVVLAGRAGRARAWYAERKLGLWVATVVLAGGFATGVVPAPDGLGLPLAALALLAGLAGLWRTRRVVYRADDYAADRTGPSTVVAAYERVADLNDLSAEHGRLTTLLRATPPLGSRLDRLRERAAADAESVDEPSTGR